MLSKPVKFYLNSHCCKNTAILLLFFVISQISYARSSNDDFTNPIDLIGLIDGCNNIQFTKLNATPQLNSSSWLVNERNTNVWFSFVANATGAIQLNLDSENTKTDLRLAYMSLWAADGTTELACASHLNPNDDLLMEYTNLTPGNTYYVSVANRYVTPTENLALYTAALMDPDTDGDGLTNSRDLDDDNDGILDSIEGTGDKDGDLLINALDLDSDGDGIPDNVEAQTTIGFIRPNADNAATYLANNGVNSAYLGGLTPINTDGVRNPDYLDTDSDDEGGDDTFEASITLSGNDADSDGLDDATDATADYSDPGGTIDNPLRTPVFLPDADGDANTRGDLDYRDTTTTLDDSFTCDARLFQTASSGGDIILYEVNNADASFTRLANLNTNGLVGIINSIGYNPVDNFIYGIDPSPPYRLYRIDNNYSIFYLGNITGLNGNNEAGVFDISGNYYVTGGSKELYRIDINTRVATRVGTTGFIAGDITINPSDSRIYAWAAVDRQLYRIDDTTAATTAIGPRNTQYSNFGSMYYDNNNNIIAYGDDVTNTASNQETLVTIDPATGIVTPLAAGPSTTRNDGCSCVFTVEMNKAAVDTIDTCVTKTISYTYTIFNSSGVILNNVNLKESLLHGLTYSREPYNVDAGLVLMASLTGKSKSNLVFQSIPIGESSFTIDVVLPSDYLGPDKYTNNTFLDNVNNTVFALPKRVKSDDPNTAKISDNTIVNITATDKNKDSFPDCLDIDFDGDGILDSVEDLNADGDNDPATNPTDSDGDLIPDFEDLDSDGDGIPDNVEAQTTTAYIAPSLVDANKNGLDDAYERGRNIGLTPTNTDGRDKPDYLDTDSDNDGSDDTFEASITLSGNDADKDGLDDAIDATADYSDPGGTIDNPLRTPVFLPDADGDATTGGDVDFRDAATIIDDPFTCDARLFQTAEVSGDVILYEVNNSDASFTQLADLSANGLVGAINSIGYNPVDNFIYGIDPSPPYRLYRIDNNYSVFYLGNITGLNGQNAAGVFDINGNYYVTGGSQKLYRIDIKTRVATLIGTTGFVTGDITINPSDNKIYGWSAADRQLFSIDETTAAATAIGAPNTRYVNFGSMYYDNNNNIIAYGNDANITTSNQETLVTIDPATGVVTPLAVGPEATINDGCSCVFTVEMNKAAVDTIDTCVTKTISYTYTIFNSSRVVLNNVNFQETLLNGLTYGREPYNVDAGLVIMASLTGKSKSDLVFQSIPIGESSFTIDVVLPSDYTGPKKYTNDTYLDNLNNTVLTLPNRVDSDDPNTVKISDNTIVNITATDKNKDSIPDCLDIDFDGDGILDTVEDLNADGDNDPATNPTDSDGDLIPNYEDLDSDGDGIPDNVEAQTTSTYVAPSLVDANKNGLDDAYESGTNIGLTPTNTDGTDTPDYLDTDSDNEGADDTVEAGITLSGNDADKDGLDNATDTTADYSDPGGTIDDPLTAPITLPDFDVDASTGGDVDFRDAINDTPVDLDSDNDGILDTVEDLNADGDNDPATNATDSDGDSIPNYQDLDSDNDGIPDNVEAQTTTAYIAPSLADVNKNGVDDAYEIGANIGLTPVNTDGTDTPDYIDTDSDNEGADDTVEAGITLSGNDADSDGLDDATDATTDNSDPGGTIDNPLTGPIILPDFDSDASTGGDVDFRDAADNTDLDTDNDGILDTVEDLNTDGDNDPATNATDSDGDSIPNYQDLDSDNDGIPDNVEAQTTSAYIAPSLADANKNGVDDAYESGANIGLTPVNTDGTDTPDYIDTDSDNEGSDDTVEAGITLSGNDADSDGLDDATDATSDNSDPGGTIDNPLTGPIILPDFDSDASTTGDVDFRDATDNIDLDTDNDGILDTVEDSNTDGDNDPATNATDSDGDSIPDYKDIDSDNDGIPDNVEAQTTSAYIAPSLADANKNGVDDAYESGTNIGLTPVNTDEADLPDYLDTDSDNDNVLDNIEGNDFDQDGIANLVLIASDKDNDGLDDSFEGTTQIDNDVNDEIDDPLTDLPDTDDDGEADYRDFDDDDDGIKTSDEDINSDGDYSNDDSDNDDIPNYLDPDPVIEYEDIEVFNVITPNGDGIHDILIINGLEGRPNNYLKVFNRWGVLVFETKSYNTVSNNFDGTSQARATQGKGDRLPTGTYFYIFNYEDVDGSNKNINGQLYIN